MSIKKIKYLLPVILTAFALVFSIFAFAYSNLSAAWLANNTAVSGEGMNVNLSTPEGINVTVTSHAVAGIEDNGTFHFSKTDGADLSTYDILDNTKNHILLRITLDSSQSIVLTADTATDYFMDREHPLLASSDGKGTDYNNALTSIIALTNISSSVADGNYNGAETFSLELPESMLTFADLNEGSMQISPSLELARGETSEIFILVSYHDDNISRVYSENIGNEALETVGEGGVKYVTDFEFDLSLMSDSNSD